MCNNGCSTVSFTSLFDDRHLLIRSYFWFSQAASSSQPEENTSWSAYLDHVFNVGEPQDSIYPPSYNMSVEGIYSPVPGPSALPAEYTPRSPKMANLPSPRSAQTFATSRSQEAINASSTHIVSPRRSATRLYSCSSPPTSNISSVLAALGRTETATTHWDTEAATVTDDGNPRRNWARIVIWVALLLIVIAGVVGESISLSAHYPHHS